MALRLCCDGCDCDLTSAAAQRRGRIDPIVVCADCATVVDEHQRVIDDERVRVVEAFQAFLAAARAAARTKVARLPDW